MRFWPPAIDGPDRIQSGGHYAVVLLNGEQFDELEAGLAALVERDARLPDGTSQLAAVMKTVYDYHNRPGQTEGAALAKVYKWKFARPDSVAAPIFEATILMSLAWQARGTSLGANVQPAGWSLFQARVDRAREILHESRQRSSANPLWYVQSLYVARSAGTPLEEQLNLYAEAVKRFPGFELFEPPIVTTLLPQWGGSHEAIARFIEAASDLRPRPQGDAMYARLYWGLRDQMQEDGPQFFTLTHADPKRILRGFEVLRTQFPASRWNQNAFASFACMANDADTYRRIREPLGHNVWRQAWSRELGTELCDRRLHVSLPPTPLISTPQPLPTLRPPDSQDGSAAHTFQGMRFVTLFKSRAFYDLEAELAKAATLANRFSDGSTWLQAAGNGLVSGFLNPREAQTAEQILSDWKQHDPQSIAQPVVAAIYWRTRAMTVSFPAKGQPLDEAKGLMREHRARALHALTEGKARSAQNPLWYQERLLLALNDDAPLPGIREIFAEGIARHPAYEPLYTLMAGAELRKGSPEGLERFAVEYTEKTRKYFGVTLYVLIHTAVTSRTPNDQARPTPDWVRLKRGFEDLDRRLPDSLWNLNNFAIFACRHADAQTYARLRSRIGATVYPFLWPTNLSPDVCDKTLIGETTR